MKLRLLLILCTRRWFGQEAQFEILRNLRQKTFKIGTVLFIYFNSPQPKMFWMFSLVWCSFWCFSIFYPVWHLEFPAFVSVLWIILIKVCRPITPSCAPPVPFPVAPLSESLHSSSCPQLWCPWRRVFLLTFKCRFKWISPQEVWFNKLPYLDSVGLCSNPKSPTVSDLFCWCFMLKFDPKTSVLVLIRRESVTVYHSQGDNDVYFRF